MSDRALILPNWPARMRAEMAAAYVDAPSIAVFRCHVRKGLYPKPYQRAGEEQAWLKIELDQALSRLAQNDNMAEEEDEFQ